MIQQQELNINFKARFFTQGKLSGKTRHILIAFHGYGQLASYFIRHFKDLGDDCFVIVAEGLHRFYLKESSGRVGASWMTKEDRLVDIENQSSYINAMLQKLGIDDSYADKITVLGFSQGVSTAMRWLVKNQIKINTFIAWAGSYPEDLPKESINEYFKSVYFIQVLGKQDPYFNDEAKEILNEWISLHKIRAQRIEFEGLHKLDSALVQQLIKDQN
jgi:predicted esterase